MKFDPNRPQKVFTAEQLQNAMLSAIDRNRKTLAAMHCDQQIETAAMLGSAMVLLELGLDKAENNYL